MTNAPFSLLAAFGAALAASCAAAPGIGPPVSVGAEFANVDAGSVSSPVGWWKGNLHTHSLWSDGADYPEMIAAWYRDHGYHFVVFTEHDRLQEGEMWVDMNAADDGWPPRNQSAREAFAGYVERFGTDWVVERREGTRHEVRLRALSEHRHLVEQPGRFLLVMGEEITDAGGAHVNVINADTALLPRGGADPPARTRANLQAVAERAQRSGRPTAAIVNHPNFVWALTPDDLAGLQGARLFEVYSGHTMTNIEGDAERPGTERMWDLALTRRHTAGAGPIYGVATDDAHDYRSHHGTVSRPGRGWVVVRADSLTPDHLVAALNGGDFYASTGVTLREVVFDGSRFRIDVEPEPGTTYRTQFIGTRGSERVDGTNGVARSDADIGVVLAEVDGAVAEYTLRGDERYVRATITSSRQQIDPTTGTSIGVQKAWVQPVWLRVSR
jgi:hypothetical protein